MAIKHAWRIDPSQSKIAFKVGYMQLGVITGEFRVFSGFVECDDAFDELDVTIMVDSRSITTFHQQRDEGIRAAEFFATETFPFIHFSSTRFRRVSSGGLFEVEGLLTIKDNTFRQQAMVSLASVSGGMTGNGAPGKIVAEAVFKFSGMLSREAFKLGGPDTPDQDSVADGVEFFGEMHIGKHL